MEEDMIVRENRQLQWVFMIRKKVKEKRGRKYLIFLLRRRRGPYTHLYAGYKSGG